MLREDQCLINKQTIKVGHAVGGSMFDKQTNKQTIKVGHTVGGSMFDKQTNKQSRSYCSRINV